MLTEAKATASQPAGLDQLLTTNEVARLLRVSRVTLWQWRRKGLVPPPIRLGLSRLRWRAQDVRDYLDQSTALLEARRPSKKTKKDSALPEGNGTALR
jgi:predicted DNA-binding transcriptional regulator AlpA